MTTQAAIVVFLFVVTVFGFILTVVIVSAFNGAAYEREKQARNETAALKSLTNQKKEIDEEIATMTDEALREKIRNM